MASTQDILIELDKGLLKAISAQEYQRPDGTRVRRADLESLVAARRELTQQSDSETNGMGIYQAPIGLGRLE